MGNSQKLPRRPRDASEEKTREKPDEKEGAEIISLTLPVTSLPILSFPVRPLPVTSLFPVTAPSQIRARSNMTYYLCSFIQCASFLWNMSIY